MSERMTAAAYRSREAVEPKPNKYRNKPTIIDGIRFASKREATYYGELKKREGDGEVADVILQPPFKLLGPKGELIATYRADFAFWDVSQARRRVVDVKGVETPEFKLKKKMMLALLGIEVEVVK